MKNPIILGIGIVILFTSILSFMLHWTVEFDASKEQRTKLVEQVKIHVMKYEGCDLWVINTPGNLERIMHSPKCQNHKDMKHCAFCHSTKFDEGH